MSASTAGGTHNETLACCYFKLLCFWVLRPLPQPSVPSLHSVTVTCLLFAFLFHFFFRLKSSTASTFRPPHRYSQTPPDRHLLHYQQRGGPGRVSETLRTFISRYSTLFSFRSVTGTDALCALALNNEITDHLKPCANNFSCPPKGKWCWPSGGSLM